VLIALVGRTTFQMRGLVLETGSDFEGETFGVGFGVGLGLGVGLGIVGFFFGSCGGFFVGIFVGFLTFGFAALGFGPDLSWPPEPEFRVHAQHMDHHTPHAYLKASSRPNLNMVRLIDIVDTGFLTIHWEW
jgi:hypothetical protein